MRIVRLLVAVDQRGCVSRLAEALGLSASKVSKHVQVLVWSGMLTAERSGRQVWLTVRTGAPQIEYIKASLLATPDTDGQFALDLRRFTQDEAKVGSNRAASGSGV
jgi:predicted ArsR family transcriptional regulator